MTALFAISLLLVLGWIPILVRFFKNWRERRNPISLAICFVVGFAIYACFLPTLEFGQDPRFAGAVVHTVNAVTCIFFHMSFSWARRRWTQQDLKYPDEGPRGTSNQS